MVTTNCAEHVTKLSIFHLNWNFLPIFQLWRVMPVALYLILDNTFLYKCKVCVMLRLIQILTHYCISINVVMLHTSMFSFYRCLSFPSSLQSQQHRLVYSVVFPIMCPRNEYPQRKFPITPVYLLTLILLTWRIWWASNNASKW